MGTGDPVCAAPDENAELVARIARGDRTAEAAFVARYAASARAIARRHARPNEPAVDDVVQDVLANVIERLRAGALRDGAALPAYVRNAVVFGVRALGRGAHPSCEDPAELEAAVEAGPVSAAEQVERQRAIREVLAELSVERDRQLIVRFYLEEQERADVCRALGIDEAHFHRVVFRARERLRARLEQRGVRHA